MAIVMINEHCENALEVSRVQNQQPIEALRTSGPDESFGDPIRLRCLNRRANDAYASALEHLNKAPREFAVVIAQQKTNRLRSFSEHPRHLPCLLRDPLLVGMRRATREVHAPASHLDEEHHV